MKRTEMIGKKFGRLTVIAEHPVKKGSNAYWICRCDCGNTTKPIYAPSLTLGRTKSCGCLQREGVVMKTPFMGNAIQSCMGFGTL